MMSNVLHRTATLSLVLMTLLVAASMTSCGDGKSVTGGGFHRRVVHSSSESYEVKVGGNLDEFNTRRYTGHYECAFQPNVSFTIANTGDTEVENPRIVINGRRNWYSIEDIGSQVVRPGMTDEEKAFAVWDWCRYNICTGPGGGGILYGKDATVVIFMNSIGVGACGTFHQAMPHLAKSVGVRSDGGCLADCSHAVQRNYWDGKDRYLDCMITATEGEQPKGHFALALDNETVAGVVECADDHYLMDRAAPADYMNALLHGPGSSFSPINAEWKDTRRMTYTLRPGESLTHEWRQIENGWQKKGELKSNASGLFRYEPRLSEDQVRKYAVESESLGFSKDGVRASDHSQEAKIAYRMSSPYILVGGRVRLRCVPSSGDKGAVEAQVRFDGFGTDWRTVWQSERAGLVSADFDLPDYDEFHDPNYAHSFVVRIVMRGGGELRALAMDARFQSYIPSLPALNAGLNNVRYVDDTEGPHEITITHRWREKTGIIPAAPALSLPVKGTEAPFNTVFRWEAVADADAYEFYLSARKDMSWPLLSTFHTVTYSTKPEFKALTPDAFTDRHTYYWKVRARSKGGAWGQWSAPESFVAKGPGRILNARIETTEGGKITLCWDAPTKGTKPVKYEVYGTQEPSFSPLRERTSQNAWTLKDPIVREPNLIKTTQGLSFDATERGESFYRVVAVDAAGSRSVPTNCISVPRPALLGAKMIEAKIGKEFTFEVPVRKSIGKLVWALKGGLIREKADDVQFRIEKGPDWLTVDPKTGVVKGVPPSKGMFIFTVAVAAHSEWSYRDYSVRTR